VFKIRLPVDLRGSIVTNVAGLPLTMSWVNQDMISMAIPTNNSDLALKFVDAHDQRGKKIDEWSGSWDKYHFRRMVDRPPRGEDAYVTIAIVPNVHMTFFTQPRLVDSTPAEN
jgi:hypothetical protein